MESSYNELGKTPAIVAYITIFGAVIAYFLNKDMKNTFASFHIRQALGIHLSFYLLGALVSMFDSWIISSSFYIFVAVLWGYGLVGAIKLEKNSVPLVGDNFQRWFTFIE